MRFDPSLPQLVAAVETELSTWIFSILRLRKTTTNLQQQEIEKTEITVGCDHQSSGHNIIDRQFDILILCIQIFHFLYIILVQVYCLPMSIILQRVSVDVSRTDIDLPRLQAESRYYQRKLPDLSDRQGKTTGMYRFYCRIQRNRISRG